MDEKERQAAEGYKKYAESQGFILNPDEEKVAIVVKGLFSNQEKHGARYCPCRIVTGDKEVDKKIICPCVYHKEEVEKDGHCHCQLFFKKQ